MFLNSDCAEMLRFLNAEEAKYLGIGAHAYIFYTEPRYTRDFDLFIEPSPENAEKVIRALRAFGAPLLGITASDLAEPDIVYQVGVAPNRIDFLTGIEGVTFEEAWTNRVSTSYDGIPFPLIGKQQLIKNKRAIGRPQDLLDVARLLEDGE